MLCRAGKETVGQATRVKVARHFWRHTKIETWIPRAQQTFCIPRLEKRNATRLAMTAHHSAMAKELVGKKLRLHITAPFAVCGSCYLVFKHSRGSGWLWRFFQDGLHHLIANADCFRESRSKVRLYLLKPVTVRLKVSKGYAFRPCLWEKALLAIYCPI